MAPTKLKKQANIENDPCVSFMNKILSTRGKSTPALVLPLNSKAKDSPRNYKTKVPCRLKTKALLPLRETLSGIVNGLGVEILHTHNLDVVGEYLGGEDLIVMHHLSAYSSEGMYVLTLAHECGHALLDRCYGGMSKAPLFRKRFPHGSAHRGQSLAFYAEEFFSETFAYLLCRDSLTSAELLSSEAYLRDYAADLAVALAPRWVANSDHNTVSIAPRRKRAVQNNEFTLVARKIYNLAERFLAAVPMTA